MFESTPANVRFRDVEVEAQTTDSYQRQPPATRQTDTQPNQFDMRSPTLSAAFARCRASMWA